LKQRHLQQSPNKSISFSELPNDSFHKVPLFGAKTYEDITRKSSGYKLVIQSREGGYAFASSFLPHPASDGAICEYYGPDKKYVGQVVVRFADGNTIDRFESYPDGEKSYPV